MRLGFAGALGAVMLLLCACQPRYLPVDDAGRITATPPPPAAAPPATTAPVEVPRSSPAARGPEAPPLAALAPAAPAVMVRSLASSQDGCGALGLRYLVGKPRTQIPVPVDLSKRRVECTSCAAAPEPDPSRVTIRYDQTTGLVTEVICR